MGYKELRIRLYFNENDLDQMKIYSELRSQPVADRNNNIRDILCDYYSGKNMERTETFDSERTSHVVPIESPLSASQDILHRIQALENGVAELQDWRVSVDKEILDKQHANRSETQEQPKRTEAEPILSVSPAPSRTIREAERVPDESVQPYVVSAHQNTAAEEAKTVGDEISPAILDYLNNLSM